MKSATIGSPKLAKAFDVEGQEFLFPLLIEVENKSPRSMVDPDTKLTIGSHGKQEITVNSEDQLKRLVTNLESVASFNGYAEVAVLRFRQPEVSEEAKKPEEEPKAATQKDSADSDVEAKPKAKRGRPAKQASDKTGSDK